MLQSGSTAAYKAKTTDSQASSRTQIGILFLFLQHTSAALTLNENCDPTVRTDMDRLLDAVVPESFDWEHVDEGPDDSVSHSKSSLVGVSLQIPITNGRLALGTWQGAFSSGPFSRDLRCCWNSHFCAHTGVYLTEFRHMSHSRKVVCTII